MAVAAAPPPARRPLSILKPAASDSSDEARTDTSASPSMNAEQSPSATSSDASVKGRGAAAKRRKDPASADDKPAPKQRKYERKTKRFIWPDDLHRLFVAAIFDVGLKNASPKALLALMEAAGPSAGLTTEHLKSHLQKYRLNYERSRAEFLEYYDRSAKRNLKRRRRQAQQRSGGVSGDANTMFVFPISNSKHRSGHPSDSDSDDSSSEVGDGNNNSMDVDAQGNNSSAHATPRGKTTPTAIAAESQARGLNFSQLMQNGQQPPLLAAASNQRQQPPHLVSGRMVASAPLGPSNSFLALAPQHLPPGYAAAAQRRHASDHELAAAVAASGYRYPTGQVPVSVSAGMPELSDPQWSILNSLMSPQIAGMVGPGGDGAMYPQVSSAVPTSGAMGRPGNGGEGFMLQEEPTDLQLQMHLAMQAQMNLHRQMLTRKVEVAQHLARHNSFGAMDASVASTSSNGGGAKRLGETWSSPQQQQHQAQQQQQHQAQQQQFQQQQQQQQANLQPRPSLPTEALGSQPPVAASNGPAAAATGASSLINEPPVPSTSTDGGQSSAGAAVAAAAAAAADSIAAAGLATETKGDDDGMDLYRWDRIDLNVELDDDDLFGFLKS